MANIADENGPPLCFVSNRDIRQSEEDPVSGLEIGIAIKDLCGDGSCIAVQKWHGTWRLYTKSGTARNTIILHGLTIRGNTVTVYHKNPQKAEQDSVKLLFGKVPFSVSSDAFASAIKEAGATLLSGVKDEQYRDKNGKLTSIKSGRRFVYIVNPSTPLPDTVNVAGFRASVYYRTRNAVTNPPLPFNPDQPDVTENNSYIRGDREEEAKEDDSTIVESQPTPENDQSYSTKLKQSTLNFGSSQEHAGTRGRSSSKRRSSPGVKNRKEKKHRGEDSMSRERLQASRSLSGANQTNTTLNNTDWFENGNTAS